MSKSKGMDWSGALWKDKVFSQTWVQASSHQEVLEPATGKVLTRVGVASAGELRHAAANARAAQATWAETPYADRARIMRDAARFVENHMEEMAQWLVRETGSTLPKAQFELSAVVTCLNEAAAMPSQPQGLVLPSQGERISLARRRPLGVVGVISPFNFPLYLSMRAVAPALAIGNAVILKPDPRTPVSGGFLIAALFEQAGLPAGVLHVLPGGGDVGEAMCMDPDIAMIQFTGSTATGRKVGELASRHYKKVSLELGGKNSLIVLEDADLDLAASNAAFGAWLHQGQICMASGRLLVHRSVAEAFTQKLAEKAANLPVGDPTRSDIALGPLISEAQLQRAHSIVQDTVAGGARLEAGGTYEGLFYAPTVLSGVKPGMRAFDEEIFAPVAAITVFDTDEEAIRLANQTEYGLSAAIISASVGRAIKIGNQLNCGLLHINDQTVGDEVVNPFGGRGASGNGTSIGGPANWDEFSQWQWVTIQDEAPRYPF